MRFKTSILWSVLRDYSDPFVAVKGTVEGDNDAKTRNKKLIFKNNTPFRSCISKINNTFIDNAEDLDIVMPMYNLFEYSSNYSMTSGSLWNYYRDEIKYSGIENNDDGNKINNNKTITIKSFEYKTKWIGRTQYDNNTLNAKSIVPLKYLSNSWRFLDLPTYLFTYLPTCEIELDLS